MTSSGGIFQTISLGKGSNKTLWEHLIKEKTVLVENCA